MVKHIILWKIKDEYSESEKESIKKNIKLNLEGLKGKISGLIDIKVNICGLKSSNVDLMLDSSFDDEPSLNHYSVNPLDRKSTRLNSSHKHRSRMPSSA